MLEPGLFARFCDVAYRHAGISLREGKEALVESRVSKRITALGLRDASAYADLLDQDEEEIIYFLDVISTNFTSFFRENDHFELLTSEAQQWLEDGRERIRVWCAASSTGEEPYSLVMTLDQVLEDRVDWKLLATDISTRVLAAAEKAVFAEDRLAGISGPMRARYFERVPGSPRTTGPWQVRPAYRERVLFRRLNLSTPPFPLHGPLDAVFCRNVMIYFDARVRQMVVGEAERLLRPGGLLFIGHAETLNGLKTGLRFVRPSVFRKP